MYRTIPLHFPKGSNVDKLGKKWRGDLNYSVRTKSDINIDALPTKEGPYYGVVLFRPWDERFSEMKTGMFISYVIYTSHTHSFKRLLSTIINFENLSNFSFEYVLLKYEILEFFLLFGFVL